MNNMAAIWRQISSLQTHVHGYHEITGNNGWINPRETWVYASSTTFTVSGDRTGYYKVGTKLKLTQSSTIKYFYVLSSSYSSPNTTVTVTGGSDYSLADAAITENYYSYANPPDFPTWFTWTPSFTGFSVDPSSLSCKFMMQGNGVLWKFYANTAGTKDGTAGTVTVSLPVTAKNVSNGTWAEITRVRNAGTWGTGLWVISPGGTVVTFYATAAGGNFTASGSTNMSSMGFYEAA